jgi:Pyridoxal-phosphate dependent enzyme/Transposase DDE domain
MISQTAIRTTNGRGRLFESILETVWDTPTIRVNNLAPGHATIYVKAEFFNPAASVKDRLALNIIEEGERSGVLKAGQTVVEATSGNTGIGLAMICAQKGYPLVVTMADSFSIERRDGLDRLDAAGITFITLRRRSPSLLAEIDSLPPSAWRTVKLEIAGRKHRVPRYYEQKARPHKRDLRQFFITDLGHDEPTILLTNDTKSTAKAIITRYAKRMLIENALCDAVRFFHIDALSSSVGLKVDFDMALLVVASGLYRLMARRMRIHRCSGPPDLP